MKSLPLLTKPYQDYVQNFRHWLETLGYSPSTCYNLPNHLQEFFYYLEQKLLLYQIKEVNLSSILEFFDYLQARSNERKTGKKLSNAHLQKYVQALKQFSNYLQKVHQQSLEVPSIPLLKPTVASPIRVLDIGSIEALYAACDHHYLGLRDRAMLSVYYGCGLRRSEGERLKVWNVKLKKCLLHIPLTKNGKERYVPMARSVVDDLYAYLDLGRPHFRDSSTHGSFFLGQKGGQLSGQMLQRRLKQLALTAGFDVRWLPQIGLHTLRHSIATHLLAGGMSLKNIGLFLGHQSLESTQRYTHVDKFEN